MRGVRYRADALRKHVDAELYEKLSNDYGFVNDGVLELHPRVNDTMTGRLQMSHPNIYSFSKEARDCIYGDKNLYSIDVVSEDLNVVLSLLGMAITGDVYGDIARRVRPIARAVVLENTGESVFAPLRKDEILVGKMAAERPMLLMSRLFDASFLTLDGSSVDGRGSHEDFHITVNGRRYVLQGMQRLVAGSKEILQSDAGKALMLLRDLDTGETVMCQRKVYWEPDGDAKLDVPTGIEVSYYHGEIAWEEDEHVLIDDAVFEQMRAEVKKTLLPYCYGARKQAALEVCKIINPHALWKLYEDLGLRAGLKKLVDEHRTGNVLELDGRRIETEYERGTDYTKYASILIQNIGVAILDELLGIAYANGLDVLCTVHDEVVVSTDLSVDELQEMFKPTGKLKYPWMVKINQLM